MTSAQVLIAALLLILVPLGIWGMRWLWLLIRAEQRLVEGTALVDPDAVAAQTETRSWLGWWLFRAGYRQSGATLWFLLATLAAMVFAGFVAYAIYASNVIGLLDTLLTSIPGNVGEVFLPLVWASPFLGVATLGAFPALIVRARRRKRVMMIEQDLPLTLDLLATLAEAGLSFDAALDRVLETQRRQRPLGEDFRLFRLEILTGRARVDSLRRLNRHVNVPWFSIFASALIHAEQVGSGLAATLRAQADDLRSRRRERALAMAMAVPVKLLFPLIICFLPGIMIASLGPILFQIVEVLDQFLGNSLGR
jgi:tight adherence protein C